MANTINKNITMTTAQAAGQTATSNGTSVDVSGAQAVIVVMDHSTGTTGIVTFERSVDGVEWSQAGATRISDGSAVTNSATNAAESSEAFNIALKDGTNLLRARISTAWTTTGCLTRIFVIR